MRLKEGDVVSKMSGILACFILAAIPLALSMIIMKVWQLTKSLNEESINEFNSQFSVLTDSLKETSTSKLVFFWRPLYLVRWLVTLLVLTAIRDVPSI